MNLFSITRDNILSSYKKLPSFLLSITQIKYQQPISAANAEYTIHDPCSLSEHKPYKLKVKGFISLLGKKVQSCLRLPHSLGQGEKEHQMQMIQFRPRPLQTPVGLHESFLPSLSFPFVLRLLTPPTPGLAYS